MGVRRTVTERRSRLSQLRILHCIPSLRSGGAERQLSILAPAQVSHGSEVRVAFIHVGDHASTLINGGVRLHQITASGNHDPRIVSSIWSLIGRSTPDVVHTWLPQMDVAAGLAALARRTPWVVAERSSADAYISRLRDSMLRPAIVRWADAVIANSQAGARLWEGRLKRNAHAHVINNVLPLAAITRSRPAQLDAFGLSAGQPAVIFVGRLAPEKNVDLLLSVAEEVCRQSSAAFLICGDGPMREKMERRIRASSLRDQLRLLGERDDVWSLMKASRAFISTSAFEGQPNAVLEAMACGCPLVVSDIPAHREFLDENTAQLVPLVRDDFVRAVLRALAGGTDVKTRVREARLRTERHDAAATALAYEVVYKEAALRHNRCAE